MTVELFSAEKLGLGILISERVDFWLFAAEELAVYFLYIRGFQEKKSILMAAIKTVETCN